MEIPTAEYLRNLTIANKAVRDARIRQEKLAKMKENEAEVLKLIRESAENGDSYRCFLEKELIVTREFTAQLLDKGFTIRHEDGVYKISWLS